LHLKKIAKNRKQILLCEKNPQKFISKRNLMHEKITTKNKQKNFHLSFSVQTAQRGSTTNKKPVQLQFKKT
jgi:hypothetical protein